MKYFSLFLLATFFFSACGTAVDFVPTSENLVTLTPEKDVDDFIQTQTPQNSYIEVADFQVSVGEVTCSLKQIPIEDDYYLSECDSDLILPINQAVTVMLIPPDDAEYVLMELFDRLDMVEILFHDALIAYFRDGNTPNQTDFVIPFSETSGEDVICGFSIMLDREVTILVKGTAQR